jgi:hypothetical protein
MRNAAVTEAIMLDAVIGASPGWLARAGEPRARAETYEMTRRVPGFSILTATVFQVAPR